MEGLTGYLRPCDGGGIAWMAVRSQWCGWAARVYRAAVMMCWACPSRTMCRSVPKSFGRWTVLVGPFPPVQCLRPFVSWDVLVLVFWWGRSKGEGLYPVQADGVFPGPVGRDVYAWVTWHGAQVHVACDGGGRERLAQGRGARGGAGRVVVLAWGVVDAVWGDLYGEGSEGPL